MDYKINPFAFASGIFPVPDVLVDENIRLASVVQLKVMLYMLRHAKQEVTKEDISQALCLDVCDVADAMIFWEERGVLTREIEKAMQIPTTQSAPLKQTEGQLTTIHIEKTEEPKAEKKTEKKTEEKEL